MRMPEAGPLGETFFEAKARAMAVALRLNSPAGGWVESVFTFAAHRLPLERLLVGFLADVTPPFAPQGLHGRRCWSTAGQRGLLP